jgi:hypothetical protein
VERMADDYLRACRNLPGTHRFELRLELVSA